MDEDKLSRLSSIMGHSNRNDLNIPQGEGFVRIETLRRKGKIHGLERSMGGVNRNIEFMSECLHSAHMIRMLVRNQ